MRITAFLISCLILFSCATHNSEGFKRSASYENIHMEAGIVEDRSAKDDEVLFKTVLRLTKVHMDNNKSLVTGLQYKADSLFYIKQNSDTLWPSYVMPVANGQPLTPEYLVAFDKVQLKNKKEVDFESNEKLLFLPPFRLTFNIKKLSGPHQ